MEDLLWALMNTKEFIILINTIILPVVFPILTEDPNVALLVITCLRTFTLVPSPVITTVFILLLHEHLGMGDQVRDEPIHI